MNESARSSQVCKRQTHSTRVYPAGSLNLLSREEVSRLSDATEEVGKWWDSAGGVPQSKVAEMEAFSAMFASREDDESTPVRRRP